MVSDDPLIKGIWCVPKYSNPGGEIYSDETVKRLAALGNIAGPNFRIMWDNAYAVHDFHDTPETVLCLLAACREVGTEDTAIMFGSTSKVTYAGAGVGFMAASQNNLSAFRDYLSAIMIGPDKVNQLRHIRLLKNMEGVREHMRKHAHIMRPKFERVLHHLEQDLHDKGIGEWTHPLGGYFISFDSMPGLATEIIQLSADAGVKLTPAGATYPYGKDPEDKNIRLAPSFPSIGEIDQAIQVFTLCVKLASARHLLKS
ncbi:MAG: aminotransferase class I/II-fold pyridoxal phosphate-dependent enzyme, partial [Pseudomonadota bacterium]